MNRGSKNRKELSRDKLSEGFFNLGVRKGDLVQVSSALSALGWIKGGAGTVLDVLLETVGSSGGVFGNSFTPIYRLPLTPTNEKNVFRSDTPAYSGSLINKMLQHPDAVRSKHPTCSVVGIGKIAGNVLDGHDASSPAYLPAQRLAKYENSKFLKLGTVLKSPGNTTIHVAQNMLKFNNSALGRYGVNFENENGEIELFVRNYVGGCSLGFGKFYDLYRRIGAVTECKIGNADCMSMLMKKTLEIDLETLKYNPSFFFCDNPLCYSCRVSWDFSPDSRFYFKLKYLAAKYIPGFAGMIGGSLK